MKRELTCSNLDINIEHMTQQSNRRGQQSGQWVHSSLDLLMSTANAFLLNDTLSNWKKILEPETWHPYLTAQRSSGCPLSSFPLAHSLSCSASIMCHCAGPRASGRKTSILKTKKKILGRLSNFPKATGLPGGRGKAGPMPVVLWSGSATLILH